MSAAPYIKFFTSDFLTGIADLSADEIGVYTVVLALIWDRGTPIPDDPAWLARRAGTSTRRFNQIKNRLCDLGKLEVRNGLIGNRRALSEVAKRDGKSDQARAAALARWHHEGEPELPLDDAPGKTKPPIKSGKSGQTSEEQDVLIPRKSERKSQKTANSDDADASSPSRARASPEPELESNNRPTPESLPLGPDADLVTLLEAVSDACGYRPSHPGQIARAMDMVKAWREEGIDFDLIVLPTVRYIVANSNDPTSSLARFDRKVRHEHAKARATPSATGRAYQPPAAPILDGPGEPPVCGQIRRELLERLGPGPFAALVNPVRFEPVEDAGGKRKPLRIIDSRTVNRLDDGERSGLLRAIAKRHGFTDVW
jgi:uncharacterized protein YdaU (DUF1376 family)